MNMLNIDRIKRRLRNFDYKRYMKANRSNILLWSCFVLFVLIVYHLVSDGDFSFLLTLGSVISLFGFSLVLVKSLYSKSVAGISLKSMECYAVAYFFRVIVILSCSSYLPFDKSGDWFYQLVESLTLVVILINIYLIMFPFKYTHNVHHDTFGQNIIKNKHYTALLLIIPGIFLALILRPQRAGKGILNFLWAAAIYIESVSILPQLHMFQKNRTGEIESFTSHFVFAMFVSRALTMFFWLQSWRELNGSYGFLNKYFAGFAIIVAQIAQMVLMSSYIYYYIKSAYYDSPMILPTSMDMRVD